MNEGSAAQMTNPPETGDAVYGGEVPAEPAPQEQPPAPAPESSIQA
jgi:hypothetical protein